MKFRAKARGRVAFVFSKWQMTPKIRACEATLSPSTNIWQKASPALQPNTPYGCPALSKAVTCPCFSPGPGSFRRGRSLPCPSCVCLQASPSPLSCTEATNNGRRTWWAERGVQEAPTLTHRSQCRCCSFSHSKSLVFSQTWVCGRQKSWVFWFFSFLKSSGSTWLMNFEDVTQDFLCCCSIF